MITFSLRGLCCAPVLFSLSFAFAMQAQTQTAEQRAASLVAKMTLEEKVSQMQNHAAAIPRLDIPEYDWWSEGLHGVARSGYATVFPQAIGLAATWDAPLMHQVGDGDFDGGAGEESPTRCGMITTRIYFGLTYGRRTSIFFAIRAGGVGRRRMARTRS